MHVCKYICIQMYTYIFIYIVSSWRQLDPGLFQRLLLVQFVNAILLGSPRRWLRASRHLFAYVLFVSLLSTEVFNVVFALGGLHLYAHLCQRGLGSYPRCFSHFGLGWFARTLSSRSLTVLQDGLTLGSGCLFTCSLSTASSFGRSLRCIHAWWIQLVRLHLSKACIATGCLRCGALPHIPMHTFCTRSRA